LGLSSGRAARRTSSGSTQANFTNYSSNVCSVEVVFIDVLFCSDRTNLDTFKV